MAQYHDSEVQQAVDNYQLGLPRSPSAGRSGELLGRGTGSSLEFQEYRQYIPGDDIRHLDWAAYARSDMLMVRLFREEISPRTEIILDCSRSMTSGSHKSRLATQLAGMFALMSGRLGGRPVLLTVDDQPPRDLGLEGLGRLASLEFTGHATLSELLNAHRLPLKRQAVRMVISDFLFPHDPETLVRQLAHDCSSLWMVQVLTQWEADPTPLGGRRMIDLETGSEADLVIERHAIEAYLSRLRALRAEMQRNCRRVHATFTTLIAERGLLGQCRDELCAAGILRVA